MYISYFPLKNAGLQLGVVAQACNPSTWEAGGLKVQGHPGLRGKDPVSKSKMVVRCCEGSSVQ
jgi:hypothetical protein